MPIQEQPNLLENYTRLFTKIQQSKIQLMANKEKDQSPTVPEDTPSTSF